MAQLLSFGSFGQAVKEIQQALNGKPSILPPLIIDGAFGPKTRSKVVEFQQRSNLAPDGVVGPLTLEELLKGLFPPTPIKPGEFAGCSLEQMRTVTDDITRAKEFIENVLSMLSLAPFVPNIGTTLNNVFKIDVTSSDNPIATAFNTVQLQVLRVNYTKLRASLEQAFPKVCEANEGIFAAFVSNDHRDETMHFSPRYFTDPSMFDMTRAATIIHERAHTVLNLSGHPGTGDAPFVKPHQGSPNTSQDQAMRNAYCYEWLSEALHPTYDPNKFISLDVITP